MKLRARWLGAPPRAGDYLMSPTRPRFAYRVINVSVARNLVSWDAARKAEARQLTIDVERVQPGAVPSTSRVHAWRWDRRAARAPSSTGSDTRRPPARRA